MMSKKSRLNACRGALASRALARSFPFSCLSPWSALGAPLWNRSNGQKFARVRGTGCAASELQQRRRSHGGESLSKCADCLDIGCAASESQQRRRNHGAERIKKNTKLSPTSPRIQLAAQHHIAVISRSALHQPHNKNHETTPKRTWFHRTRRKGGTSRSSCPEGACW